jgi:transglutaminase-like putative cysteine protease
MSIHVAIHHVTRYRYDQLINLGPQVIRLRPAPHCRTRILSYGLQIEPAKHFLNWQQDPFANYLARAVIPDKTREFEVVVDLVAEMAVYNPFDFFLEPQAENFPFKYSPELLVELGPYLRTEAAGQLLTTFIKNIPRRTWRSIDFLVELNSRVHRKVSYTIRMEPGVQTPEQTLALGSGSCRDSGWLLVQALLLVQA